MPYTLYTVLAQTPHDLGTIGEGEGLGPWNEPRNIDMAAGYFTKIFSNLIGLLTIIGGLWFILQLIISGYNWLSAGGDKAGVQNAQKRLTNAFVGLIVVIIAYALAWVVSEIFGFKLLNPGELIKQIGPS